MGFLRDQKKNGKLVAGYGAAAKGNTLLNFCGVKEDSVNFIVDKNPHKQGMYSPGSKIPIVEEKVILEKKPDIIVIFPWNIKEEIENQLTYVREWGCKFAVANPVLFSSIFFKHLMTLTGDHGAKNIVSEHQPNVQHLPLPGSVASIDLDTPEDWKIWKNYFD